MEMSLMRDEGLLIEFFHLDKTARYALKFRVLRHCTWMHAAFKQWFDSECAWGTRSSCGNE
jgi:hypothetical protein